MIFIYMLILSIRPYGCIQGLLKVDYIKGLIDGNPIESYCITYLYRRGLGIISL